MIKIIRFYINKEKECLGLLYINNIFFCFTMENTIKRIPEGIYNIEIDYQGRINDNYANKYGEKYKKIYKVNTSKIGRTEILFHIGNYYSDSEGCILLGETINKIEKEYFILNSKNAYFNFFNELEKYKIEDIKVEIKEI